MNPKPDAAWTARLTSPVDEATTRRVLHDRRSEDSFGIAQSWSIDHDERGLRELDAAARGLEIDRMAELLECVEAVSEHFGIAVAAGNEVALWEHLYGEPPPLRSERRHVELARQALGSLCGHHLLSTGHGVAAVALRCLALEPALHSHMLDRFGTTCPPGAEGPNQRPVLTADRCRDLKRVARLSRWPSQLDLAALVSTVAGQPAWIELDGLRPPDAPGIPAGSAWVEGPGYRAYAWDRAGVDLAPVDLLVQVERLLAAKLPDIRAQIDVVLRDVVP